MKLKNLDKATKIYSAIQELDKEIIKIEKRANELANGNFEVSVKLDFKSLDPKAKKVKFDEDGSLCIEDNRNDSNRYVFSFMLGGIGEPSKPKEDKNEFEIKIDEKAALYMLGALLSIKNDQRKALIQIN